MSLSLQQRSLSPWFNSSLVLNLILFSQVVTVAYLLAWFGVLMMEVF